MSESRKGTVSRTITSDADFTATVEVWASVDRNRIRTYLDITGLLTDEQWAVIESHAGCALDRMIERDRVAEERQAAENREAAAKNRMERLRRVGRGSLVCVVCGEADPDRLHVDHVVPKSRGGNNHLDNLQLLCATCNYSKGARTMEEWVGVTKP